MKTCAQNPLFSYIHYSDFRLSETLMIIISLIDPVSTVSKNISSMNYKAHRYYCTNVRYHLGFCSENGTLVVSFDSLVGLAVRVCDSRGFVLDPQVGLLSVIEFF